MVDRVWGVSKIKDLHQCPRMFVSKYETKPKRWVEMPSAAMDRGTRLHTELEHSITYDLALGDELASVREFVDSLVQMKKQGVQVMPELQFGLDKSFNRVDFFKAPGLRARVKMDVYVNDGGKVLVIDWKTGQYKEDHRKEARFYGAACMVALKAKTCTVMYVYTDNMGDTFSEEIEKPEAIMTAAWESFDKADLYLSTRMEDTPTNMGRHCGWCGDLECQYNKNDKARAWLQSQDEALKLKDLFT